MSFRDPQARRRERELARQARVRRRRAAVAAFVLLLVVVGAVVAAAAGSGGKSSGSASEPAGAKSPSSPPSGTSSSRPATTASSGTAPASSAGTGQPGHAVVPILMYHVINPPPPGARFPGLYVPAEEFAAQMQALKSSGWHAVTMDQMRANWTRGASLGAGKPIVISFDNGYASQYTKALPVLKAMGWVGVENIQLSGLPPSQGGLTDAQVRGLLAAGWELDTQGISHADLIALTPSELHYQVATARQMLRSRYGVPVNWFCYPSGHYNARVVAEVKAAGFVGSTTVVPGWAAPADDAYALPRLRVLAGTTPSALLRQIAQAEHNPPPGASYGSGGAGTG